MGETTELQPGEVFGGRYVVQRILGEGDRKRTYLAQDTKVGRSVALSLVKPEAVLDDPEGAEREARVLGRIGAHGNIVSLYDYGTDGSRGIQYMVFEYLDGGTLTERLSKSDPPPLDDILRLGRQLSRGLSHLHARGLIHRDVSLDNVWFGERDSAHLGDFDSAIMADSPQIRRPLTTNAFAAPEEREAGALGVRSDLYSLGAVLYATAVGEERPESSNRLCQRRPDLPTGFADLVAGLLSKSPADRPANADAVLERLNEIRYTSNVEAIIAGGEGDSVEFKSSLHHAHGPLPDDLRYRLQQGKLTEAQVNKEVRRRLNGEVTTTIAAFLNTSGGTLLIGVADSGAVLGVEPDFGYCQRGKHNADGWMLSLKQVIINALTAEIWSAIRVSLVSPPAVQKTVAVILCPPRATETWHCENTGEHLYIRASNSTEEVSGRNLVTYVRERWPA